MVVILLDAVSIFLTTEVIKMIKSSWRK